MTQDQIMELVDDYAMAQYDLAFVDEHGDGKRNEARAAVVAALEALTKDAERYRVGREAEYAGLMPTFRAGRTWADAMDSAYDAAIAAKKEQV